MKLSFEISKEDRKAYTLPLIDVTVKQDLIPHRFTRDKLPELPEVSEIDVARHFTELSSLNFHIEKGFYPLGSCTMKYNPKINEDIARFSGFSDIHPLQNESTIQGALKILYELQKYLAEISGMNEVTLQPVAGAHGELTGMLMARAYFNKKGEKRNEILVPDSAHGTNPATSTFTGFTSIEIKSNDKGLLDINALKEAIDKDVACLMLTVPNTLGLFESQIEEIADIVHKNGTLLYLDGANLNAFMGIAKPGDMGFDIVHFNLHKTFSTPHGTGGPGGGGIGVKKFLAPFLPVPRISYQSSVIGHQVSASTDNRTPITDYHLSYDFPNSIGRVHSFYGNFNVCVKAYTYIRMLGAKGIRRVAENAVINANYLMNNLKDYYNLSYKGPCMHEFVLSGNRQKEFGIRTLDIAKRLLDFGFHPPTIYFPLIVHEALMIEPTETESKEMLDKFIDVMIKIAKEAKENPEVLKTAPYNTPVTRLDEAKAAKNLDVRF